VGPRHFHAKEKSTCDNSKNEQNNSKINIHNPSLSHRWSFHSQSSDVYKATTAKAKAKATYLKAKNTTTFL